MVVQVVPRLVERCTTNDVSVMELSFQRQHGPRGVARAGVYVLVRPLGATGGSASVCGRIMSISSWLRMWQC